MVVKFADVKKTHTAKGWLVPDGRGASPIGFNGGGMRQGNYWQATAPPGGGGGGGGGARDVYPKGREVYPAPYPYQVFLLFDMVWCVEFRSLEVGCLLL